MLKSRHKTILHRIANVLLQADPRKVGPRQRLQGDDRETQNIGDRGIPPKQNGKAKRTGRTDEDQDMAKGN